MLNSSLTESVWIGVSGKEPVLKHRRPSQGRIPLTRRWRQFIRGRDVPPRDTRFSLFAPAFYAFLWDAGSVRPCLPRLSVVCTVSLDFLPGYSAAPSTSMGLPGRSISAREEPILLVEPAPILLVELRAGERLTNSILLVGPFQPARSRSSRLSLHRSSWLSCGLRRCL